MHGLVISVDIGVYTKEDKPIVDEDVYNVPQPLWPGDCEHPTRCWPGTGVAPVMRMMVSKSTRLLTQMRRHSPAFGAEGCDR
jgi:hypothetical protein